MNELEHEILAYLNKENKKIKFNKIKRELKIQGEDNLNKFLECLKSLECHGLILFDEKNESLSIFPKKSIFHQGYISINKFGVGFVKVDNKSFAIPNKCLYSAQNGDIVLIVTTDEMYQNRTCAIVKKVIKRNIENIACVYLNGELIPYGVRLPYKIKVNENELKKYVNLSILLVHIANNPCDNNNIEGEILSTIANQNDPNYEEKIIATKYGFPLTFSEKCLEEANKITDDFNDDEIKKRLDLRKESIFTIDCDSTKDMDDAVSIKKLANGNYELGVHIAHVSHYVNPTSNIWKEACARGTSVYMANSVIPMLPQNLSNGICSLNPNVDRLTLSTIMEINDKGEIIKSKVVPSIINSKAKMKYSEVNELLENDNNVANYPEDLIAKLKIMQELSNIIEQQKDKRGCLTFASSEVEIKYDDNNMPINFIKRDSKTAEKIIENFMISANVAVAENFSWMPFLYRIHDLPDLDKLSSVLKLINDQFYSLPQIQNINNRTLQNILKQISKLDNYNILSALILPSMARAEFSTNNIGHFGLALDNYSQSTSPIRRFNDLVIQHLIDSCTKIDDKNCHEIADKLTQIAIHCSERELAADRAEREADKVEMAKYIQNHLDEEFEAVVTNIGQGGLTIETSNNILGYIPLNNIKDDYYEYNDKSYALIGSNHHHKIYIGDNVIVKPSNIDISFGIITFNLNKVIDKNKYLKRQKSHYN